jgi:hypothetical protein
MASEIDNEDVAMAYNTSQILDAISDDNIQIMGEAEGVIRGVKGQ